MTIDQVLLCLMGLLVLGTLYILYRTGVQVGRHQATDSAVMMTARAHAGEPYSVWFVANIMLPKGQALIKRVEESIGKQEKK